MKWTMRVARGLWCCGLAAGTFAAAAQGAEQVVQSSALESRILLVDPSRLYAESRQDAGGPGRAAGVPVARAGEPARSDPRKVAGWDQLPLFAGDVNDMAENSKGMLFAATYTGVFRSTDDAAHWESAGAGLPTASAITIAVDAADKLYVSVFTRGIYTSTDDGISWMQTSAPTDNIITSLAVGSGGLVLAGTANGLVLRSANGGVDWDVINSGQRSVIQCTAILDGGVVLAGTLGRGVVRSLDNGQTWAPTALVSGFARSLLVLPAGRALAAIGTSITFGGELLQSLDAGATWDPLASPCSDGVAVGLAAGTEGAVFAACARTGVARSTDGEQTWTPPSPALDFGAHDVLVDRQGNVFLCAIGQGVFRSTNGGDTWVEANIGLTAYQVEAFAADHRGNLLVATSASGVFKSPDNGHTWVRVNKGIRSASVLSLAHDPLSGKLFAGTVPSGMYTSADEGDTWTDISAGLPGTDAVNAIDIDPLTGTVVIGKVSNGPWRLIDFAPTWEPLLCGLTDFAIQSLARNADSEIVAGTDHQGVFLLNGETSCWSLISEGLPAFPGAIRSMARSPTSLSLLVTSFHGVFRLRASDSSWAPTGLGIPSITSLDVNSEGVAFAGAGIFNVSPSNDVLLSEDDGDTWISLRGDLATIQPVTAIESHHTGLYAGTWHGGLFVGRSIVTGVDDPVHPSRAAWLDQNHPNPFWHETTIRYRLARTSPVVLSIYDVTGRKLLVLSNTIRPAGESTVTWDGRDARGQRVPGGVYLCRIHAAEFEDAKKMILQP